MPPIRSPQSISRTLVLGLALIGLGTIGAVLSVLADSLGIGGGGQGFGYQQLIVLIISLVVILLGVGIVAQHAIERAHATQDMLESDR